MSAEQRVTDESLTIADYEAALADNRRLVREIDIAMHGEEGAAPQASLCDLIPLAERARTAHRATEAKLTAALAEVERLHAKLHEATIDSGPMLGESMGAALGNAIAGYRDSDMKRAAAGLVAAVHILRRLEDDRDKFRWQVRDTCTRAEAAESALAATKARLEAAQQGLCFFASVIKSGEAWSDVCQQTLDAALAAADAAMIAARPTPPASTGRE